MNLSRDQLIQLDDDELTARCRIDRMRGTGPGGQKRNKTESAVRITHLDTGLFVTDDVTRSQHRNLENALIKLRFQFALSMREEYSPCPFSGKPTNDQLPLWIAHVLDALQSTNWQAAPAAKMLNWSTSQILKYLAKIPSVWQYLNTQRQKFSLPPLKQ